MFTEYWKQYSKLNRKDEPNMKLNKEQVNVIMARKQLSIRDVCERGNLSEDTFKQAKGKKYKTITPITAGKIAIGLGVDVTEIIESGD